MLQESAMKIIKDGGIRVKVKRAGMLQFVVFKVKWVKLANTQFVELFVDRMVDLGELIRLANELGLPVEAETRRVFPEGKGAKDFVQEN